MISSGPVTSKFTLIIPNYFFHLLIQPRQQNAG